MATKKQVKETIKTNGPDLTIPPIEQPIEQSKQKPKKFFKNWTEKNVIKDLENQISILFAGRNNYTTLAKLASQYKITAKEFKAKCNRDTTIANLFEIYNSVYLEHIMTQALRQGKINTQTEEWLRNELQAFSGSGIEQNIRWILDDVEVKNISGEKMDIVPDKEVDKTNDNDLLFEEIDDENDQE